MNSIIRLRILAFGASLTEGFYSGGFAFHPYTIHLSQLLRSICDKVDIENAGLSGEAVLSDTMLPRLQRCLSTANKYDWVMILAGTNDTIRDQQKASDVFNGYKLLINECRKHGARVLSMTLPEVSCFPRNSPLDRQREEFNRLLREELIPEDNDNNIIVLDVDRLLPQHSLSASERKRIWDDEIHLTPQGYDQLGQLIYEKLKTFLI